MKNNHFQKLNAALLLTFTVVFCSCQHDDVIKPQQADEAPSPLRESAISSSLNKYQLVKDGSTTLSYAQDGSIRKVVYGIGGRGNYSTYTQYFYNSGSVITKTYYNDRLSETITYLLDAAGRCYESQHEEYIPLGPNITQEKKSSFSYAYNTKGQLTTRTDKKSPDNFTKLDYDTDGNLVKISYYAFSLYTPGPSLLGEVGLSYQPMGGDPQILDLSHLNNQAANLPDPYLHVFGKGTKYLATMITENATQGGKYFSYTINEDGYPTSRKTYNLKGGALTETTDYGYLVTKIGLNL